MNTSPLSFRNATVRQCSAREDLCVLLDKQTGTWTRKKIPSLPRANEYTVHTQHSRHDVCGLLSK